MLTQIQALRLLAHLAAATTGLLLIGGGIGKLTSIGQLRSTLSAYEILPSAFVPTLAYALPIAELLVGTSVLLDVFNPAANLFAALLFLAFAAGGSTNLLRGRREIPCGCFGARSQQISWFLVTRHLVLVALVLFGTGRALLMSGSAALCICAVLLHWVLRHKQVSSEPAPAAAR